MTKNWLSLVVISQFLFFIVTAPPHTVHHGLHDADPQECPVLAAADQANSEFLEDFSLAILLPCTHDAPIFDSILRELSIYSTFRSRAPPLGLQNPPRAPCPSQAIPNSHLPRREISLAGCTENETDPIFVLDRGKNITVQKISRRDPLS